ncbi:MAG: methyltransferase [Micromonosporaceae bacterium]|nr:methyltransferase [Micromonosporaceae bacterium]
MTTDHYFVAEPATPEERRPIAFDLAGRTYRLVAARGVFSADRLDPGTAVLLRKAALPAPGSDSPYLDLGCGYGPIAVVLATQARSTVYAIDVNRRALDLARANARAAGVDDLVVAATPDAVPPETRFAQIWSNPPIRIGKTALHELLDTWLPRLLPDGTAWLVVSRNLGGDTLHHRLMDQGWNVVRHASQKGYRVLRITRSIP